MTDQDIASIRLSNHHLDNSSFENPRDVVGWLGAVQAQDYHAAKWTLGLRMKTATDQGIEQAFNEGSILRTHVMRPTWHFVLPEDIRWMLALTAPRVHAFGAYMYRKEELDKALFDRAHKILAKALENGKQLTRTELAHALKESGINASGQRLAYIIMHAELDAVICSGARRGKQFTYALLEDRVPKAPKLSREESLAKLALTYFTSHGPAQQKDFAWWSGLAIKDAQEGLESVKSKLVQEKIGDKTYWFSPHAQKVTHKSPTVFLLSIFDEYTIAYRDRSALGGERYFEKLIAMGNALTSVIILDGKIVGTWKRILKKEHVDITVSPFFAFDKAQRLALYTASESYGKFHQMAVKTSIVSPALK